MNWSRTNFPAQIKFGRLRRGEAEATIEYQVVSLADKMARIGAIIHSGRSAGWSGSLTVVGG